MKKFHENQNNYKLNMYHGTREENVLGIARNNFDWRLSNKNVEALYGDGVYFSNSSNYSDDYATKSENDGEKNMFIASVLVGEYTQGCRGLKHPPVKSVSQNGEEIFFDSCVDDVLNPRIFVIFDFNNVYPSFLIKYKTE